MKHRAVVLWLAFLVLGIFIASRVQIGADLSAFLPRNPTPAQQLLTDQLRDGMVSRLILVGIEGDTPDALAQTSERLAQLLRNEPDFVLVNNGEQSGLARDTAYLFDNRYLLSPSVTPEHFTANALHASLENALQLLGTPVSSMLKRVLPRDPSGELLQLLDQAAGQNRPASHDGVWMAQDGKRALLLLQTRAPGFDIDAQQRAVALIRARFAAVTGAHTSQHLLLSGPGVFAVDARSSIKDVALYFALITAVLVSMLLLLVYRSWRVLGLALLPVASGALGGVAAVSLGFGVVYGVTLGFGITLIGEAVDYAIYFFTRLAPGQPPGRALDRIWPTLRLGVLTTVCGFSPMFLAGFPGLAQLGLFSVTGIVIALLVARWVLPALTPATVAITPPAPLTRGLMRLIGLAPRLRPLLWISLMAAALVIALHRGPLWSKTLSSLSPVPVADQRLDEALRRDLGAPDVRYLVIAHAPQRESTLERAEAIGAQLDKLLPRHILSGYDTPARYLPSAKTQQARINALPDDATLHANLQQALAGLPFRDGVFKPFLQDVAAARARGLLTPADLQGTSLGLQTESLLLQRRDGWLALLPLRGVTDMGALHHALAQDDDIVLLDLKQESDALYRGYVREAVMLSLAGAGAIVLLLFASLRAPRRVVLVLSPLAAALLVTTALVLASGQQLLLFHLVGLLLAAAIGSNYSLFFERASSSNQASGEERQRTMVSLLVANLSTTIGFGMLAFSGVPVLTAIGSTVALGAFLSLLFSAVLMGHKVAG